MNKFNLLIFVFACFCFACSQTIEEEPKAYPTLTSVVASEISDSGVTFTASLRKATELDISDHGFVWSTDSKTIFSSSDLISLGASSGFSSFTSRLNTRLREGQRYYVRSFVEIDELRVLSDTISFVSLGSEGPELISFSPEMANLSDLITIKGNGFSTQNANNKVFFGDFETQVIESKVDTLLIRVPDNLNVENPTVRVETMEETSAFNKPFQLISPAISSFSSEFFKVGDTIQITNSTQIPQEKDKIGIELEYKDGSRQEIPEEAFELEPLRFKVPLTLSYSDFKVVLRYNNLESVSEQTLSMTNPVIENISKAHLKYYDVIMIIGRNFNPIMENNEVYLGNVKARVLSSGINSPSHGGLDFIEFQVPDSREKAYESRELELKVSIFGLENTQTYLTHIVNQWFRLNNSPLENLDIDASLSHGDKGYILKDNKLLSFQSDSQTWIELAQFPGRVRTRAAMFALGNHIYFGLGQAKIYTDGEYSDIWKYSIPDNRWEQIQDFPGAKRQSSLSFSYKNLGYIGAGVSQRSGFSLLSDFWSFDPISEAWSQIAEYPGTNRASGSYGYNRDGLFIIGIRETINEIYQYNEENYSWNLILTPDQSVAPSLRPKIGFFENSSTLFLFQRDRERGSRGPNYTFNTRTKSFGSFDDGVVPGNYLFTVGEKMYTLNKTSSIPNEMQFWEFDPNQN